MKFFFSQLKRIVCGTITPTNPMSPLTATEAAVPSEAAMTVIKRMRLTFRPKEPASSSPTVKASKRLLARKITEIQIIVYGANRITSSQPAVLS